jgi:hypothetical protein
MKISFYLFILSFLHLLICVYIVWAISPHQKKKKYKCRNEIKKKKQTQNIGAGLGGLFQHLRGRGRICSASPVWATERPGQSNNNKKWKQAHCMCVHEHGWLYV